MKLYKRELAKPTKQSSRGWYAGRQRKQKQTHSPRNSKHQKDSSPADKTRSIDHAARAISRFHNTNSYNIFGLLRLLQLFWLSSLLWLFLILWSFWILQHFPQIFVHWGHRDYELDQRIFGNKTWAATHWSSERRIESSFQVNFVLKMPFLFQD